MSNSNQLHSYDVGEISKNFPVTLKMHKAYTNMHIIYNNSCLSLSLSLLLLLLLFLYYQYYYYINNISIKYKYNINDN